MKKDDIRTRVRARKKMIDEAERQAAAARVFDALTSMAAFTMAERILIYHSLPDELSTPEFIHQWEGRKQFFLPRVCGVDLDILPYERTRTHLGAFRIEEPDGDDLCDVESMDMIIVPAVAYDRAGNRVGRGKGYYDRLLRKARALKVGVCYGCQLFDEGDFDVDDHDVAVDVVITDSDGIIRFRR